jgi:hypothetical protein
MSAGHSRTRLFKIYDPKVLNGSQRMAPNPPVNAGARASVVPCIGWAARAGYWERYVAGRNRQ